MSWAERIPMLAVLPKVELAKLVSDIEEISFEPGAVIRATQEPSDWLYFVLAGEAEAYSNENDNLVPLLILGPQDLFGEESLTGSTVATLTVVARTKVTVCKISATRFAKLLTNHPHLNARIMTQINRRFSFIATELARSRQMLSAYMDEVWNSIPEAESASTAMAAAEELAPSPPPPRLSPRPEQSSHQIPWALALKTSLGIGLSGLTFWLYRDSPTTGTFTAILVWAACNWLLGTFPDYAVAVAASVLCVLFGVAKPGAAFSGFANTSWFLLLGVLGIGVAVSRSGLLYRFSLHMLSRLPPTYYGQSLALALTGVLFTPLLPSANSRSAMASPLARELSDAMRFKPRSNGSAGLAMSSFLGFGQMYFLFFNGTNICMLAWSLLPESSRSDISWTSWLWYALPLGLFTFLGCYIAILLMHPPEPTAGVLRRTIESQLIILGRLSSLERTSGWVLGLVLLGFVTQAIHQVDPAWVAMGGFLALTASGIVSRDSLKLIDWSFLLLVGSLVSLSEVTKSTGISDELTSLITPILEPLGGSPYLFLGGIAILMIIVRLAVPIQQAVMVMVMSLIPVTLQFGYHPFVVALVVLALSNSWILPQQNSMYLTVHSGTEESCFTHRQVRPLALVQAAIGVAAVLATIPFWQWVGLVP